MTRNIRRRIRHVVVYKILHADDTPHRIALGVAIGVLVACSPLLGLHMLLGYALAVVLRANRTIPLIVAWISNPATAIPIFTFNWMVGHSIMPSSALQDRGQVRRLLRDLIGVNRGVDSFVDHLFSGTFWSAALELFVELGAELWIGSLLVGSVGALAAYFLTRRAVTWRRKHRRAQLGRSRTPESALRAESTPIDCEAPRSTMTDSPSRPSSGVPRVVVPSD